MDLGDSGVQYVLGLITNATSSAFGHAAKRFSDHQEEAPEWTRGVDLAVQAALQEAGLTQEEMEIVGGFLRSEHATYLAEIGASVALEVRPRKLTKGFAQEVDAHLTLYTDLGRKTQDLVTQIVTETFLRAIGQLPRNRLDARARLGWPSADSLLKLSDQRAAKLSKGVQLSTYTEFINLYNSLLQNRLANLVMQHLDEQRVVPLREIYVEPSLNPRSRSWTDTTGIRPSSTLTLKESLSRSHRTVILGDPGAGKSTLMQFLAMSLLQSEQQSSRYPTFVVELRRYFGVSQGTDITIVEYIESQVRRDLQLDPPSGCIEILLLTGRCVVMFDGLDEVVNSRSRLDVSRAVDAFGLLYAHTPIYVTSRRIGYREAPLDGRVFNHFSIAPFNDDQVSRYAEQWFALELPQSRAIASERASNFLVESAKHASELRENPLMLSLLCGVYRGTGSIPTSRAELYESCARLLYDRWDALRLIGEGGAYRPEARQVLYELALWIWEDPEKQRGVSQTELIRRIAQNFAELSGTDFGTAQESAAGLVASWRGRAWILTDVATTRDFEPIFKFTHQTFLEFFAAVQYVRMSDTPEALYRLFRERIASTEGEVVTTLAVSVCNAQRDHGADRFLTALMNDLDEYPPVSQLGLLAFSLRLTDMVTVSHAVWKALARHIVKRWVEEMPDPDLDSDLSEYFASSDNFNVPWETLDEFDERAESAAIEYIFSGHEPTAQDVELLYVSMLLRSAQSLTRSRVTLESLDELIGQTDDSITSKALVAAVASVDLLTLIPALQGSVLESCLNQAWLMSEFGTERARNLRNSHWIVAAAALSARIVREVDVASVIPWQCAFHYESLLMASRCTSSFGPVLTRDHARTIGTIEPDGWGDAGRVLCAIGHQVSDDISGDGLRYLSERATADGIIDLSSFPRPRTALRLQLSLDVSDDLLMGLFVFAALSVESGALGPTLRALDYSADYPRGAFAQLERYLWRRLGCDLDEATLPEGSLNDQLTRLCEQWATHEISFINRRC